MLAEVEKFRGRVGRISFMLLEKEMGTEISRIFERHGIAPNIHFTTWDDYAIMFYGGTWLGIVFYLN